MRKIIEETETYSVIQDEFEGLPLTIKQWKCTNEYVDIRVNDAFAKANGYKSVDDMITLTIGKAKMIEMFGGVPDWIRATSSGEFIFMTTAKDTLN